MGLFKRANSPFWWAEFVVNGRRVSRSTGTASYRDAEAFERELKRQTAIETPRRKRSPSLTLDDACGRYWAEHGHRLANGRQIKRQLLYIVEHLDKRLSLAELSAKHVTEFVSSMRSAGVGEIAINRTVTCLQGIHNRAAKRWEEPVKVIGWRLHKSKENERTNWISQDQARRLLEALPIPTRRLVTFILTSGIRRNEAFDLTWNRVDLDKGIIKIVVKGGNEREVDLSPEAIAVLESTPRDNVAVFDTTNWRKRFDAAEAAAGLTDFRWHDMRHSFATWLGQSGAALEVIKHALGHSAIAVTAKYRHTSAAEVRAALQKVPTLSPNSKNVISLKRS